MNTCMQKLYHPHDYHIYNDDHITKIPQFIHVDHGEMSMLQVLEVKERTVTPS